MLNKLFLLIPFKRLVLYFIVLSLLPFFFVIYHFTNARNELHLLREKVEHVKIQALQKEQKQSLNQLVRKFHSNADPLYLDHSLEQLVFLKKEKTALEQLFQSKSFTGNEAAESRYQFLISKANKLQFSQASTQTAEGIQETVEVLSHPIEVDGMDIKEILNRIEGKKTHQPQLLITDFKLIKKTQPERSEVFELNLKLLKREFLTS